MHYTIRAHPTPYNGVLYRSRLEARWAAFFDLCGWEHEYEPVDLVGWTPDFRVRFPCGHSECSGSHSLLVEVKPHYSIKEFEGHPCMNYPWGEGLPRCVDGAGAFGVNPGVTSFEICHGAGGGIYGVSDWADNTDALWKEAGNRVQWHPSAGFGATYRLKTPC